MSNLRQHGVDFAIETLKLDPEQAAALRAAAIEADEADIRRAVTEKRVHRPSSAAAAANAVPAEKAGRYFYTPGFSTPDKQASFVFSYYSPEITLSAEPEAPTDFFNAKAMSKIPLRVFSLLHGFAAKLSLEARESNNASYDIGRLQESLAAAGVAANRAVENLRTFEHSMNSLAAEKKVK